MANASLGYLVAGLLFTAPTFSGSNPEPHVPLSNCTVMVYVSGNTTMPDGMFPSSRLRTTAMFRAIGLTVRIANGLPEPTHGSCGAPFVLEIDESAAPFVSSDTLAYALPYKNSGVCIHVLSDRIAAAAPRPPFTSILLAHVMVHEISHVLQHMPHHSGSGVMKAHWTFADLHRMQCHSLPFHPGRHRTDPIRPRIARFSGQLTPGDAPGTLGELSKTSWNSFIGTWATARLAEMSGRDRQDSSAGSCSLTQHPT